MNNIYVFSLYNLSAHWQNISTFKSKMLAEKFGLSSFQNALNFLKFNPGIPSIISYLLQGVINCKLNYNLLQNDWNTHGHFQRITKRLNEKKKTQKLNWAIYYKISKKMLFPSLIGLISWLCAHSTAQCLSLLALLLSSSAFPHSLLVNEVFHYPLTLHRNGYKDVTQKNPQTTLSSSGQHKLKFNMHFEVLKDTVKSGSESHAHTFLHMQQQNYNLQK